MGRAIAVAAVGLLALAACGDDGDGDDEALTEWVEESERWEDAPPCDEVWVVGEPVAGEAVGAPCDDGGTPRAVSYVGTDCARWNDYGWWTEQDPTLRELAAGDERPSPQQIDEVCGG